jgi:ADP-ribose pyrophosphatase
METWTKSDILFDGKVVRLRTGEVELDDGTKAYREVVEHPGGVCVVPFDGDVVTLVRQYRIAVGDYVLEAPAGKLEPGDDPEARGRAELEEECGLVADTFLSAGTVYATVGFCSEKMHLYLALDLTETEQRLEPEERIELVHLTLDEVRARLKAHQFNDAKTVVVLYALLQHLAS